MMSCMISLYTSMSFSVYVSALYGSVTSVISREPTEIESSLLASLLRKEGEVDNSENNVGNGNFHSSCIHYVFQYPSLLQLCHIYTQHSF